MEASDPVRKVVQAVAKTIVYIDFDGVINAINHMPPIGQSGWYGEWSRENVNGYQLIWSHDFVEELRKLSARPDVTIKWLTTWTHDAVTMLAPAIGVGADWEVLGSDESAFDDFTSWWKLEELVADVTLHKPDRFVWIDDDIPFEKNVHPSLQHLPGEHYILPPKTSIGCTRDEFGYILNFINR